MFRIEKSTSVMLPAKGQYQVGVVRKIIRGLCLPFCIGNSSKGAFIFTDGSISSTTVVACILPILIIATILMWIDEDWHTPYIKLRYQVLFALYIGSIATTTSLAVAIFRNRTGWLRKNVNIDLSTKPKLLFLWLFGISISVNAALNMTANINCIIQGATEAQGFSVVNHIVAITFYCGQLVFLSYFVNYTLMSSVLLNYSMSCMLITHVVQWLNVVLVTFTNKVTSQNHTLNSTDCFWNSDISTFRESITPFIIPAQTEYSILSAAFILRIWIQSSDNHKSTMPDVNKKENEEELKSLLSTKYRSYHNREQSDPSINSFHCSGLSYEISHENHRDQGQEESQFSIRQNGDGSEDLDRENVAMESENPYNRERLITPRPFGYFYITVLFGLILSIPMCVGTVYATVAKHESTVTRATVFVITRLVFSIIHFLSIVVTYCLLQSNGIKSATRRFSGKDYIIILCTGGTVAFTTLVLFAGIKELHSEQHFVSIITVIEAVLNIVTIYLQTLLIFHSDQYIAERRTCAFEYLFFFLSILNFLLWLSGTISTSNVKETSEISYAAYGKIYWSLILDILYPVTIFYRFHSSMDMYEKYREFQMYPYYQRLI